LFGGRVKDLRGARGWTQEELAKRMSAAGCPMHQTTVAKLERGNRPTTIGEVSVIAAIFSVRMATLFEDYEGQDYELLAVLASRLAALAAERVKLTERLTSLDAEYASVEAQHRDLQQRVEEDEGRARQDMLEEREWEAFMNSGDLRPEDFMNSDER
jgi:transcriptional regulator with XRE-family HTH domain